MADEATGQGAVEAAAPAVTQETAPEAAAPVDAAPQEATPEVPEFDGLFDGEEPALESQASDPLSEYLSVNPAISSPELLRGAIDDAGLMWSVVKGEQPASALFETLRQNNPQAWQSVMQGAAQYLEQVSGMKLMNPAEANQPPQTPEQQRIAQLEQRIQTEERQRSEFALAQKVEGAQKQVLASVTQALKGSFMEGNEAYAMQMVGQKLAGKEQAVIDALARGDRSMLDNALKQVRHEERIRFNAYGKRLASERKALSNSLPKADGSGSPPDGKVSKGFDLSTREGRIAYASQQFAS